MLEAGLQVAAMREVGRLGLSVFVSIFDLALASSRVAMEPLRSRKVVSRF